MPELKTRETFDQVLREHADLRARIQAIRNFLEEPRPEIGHKGYHSWATGLTERLVGLHDELFRHFREEEESGVLEDLGRMSAGAVPKVAALAGEHAVILESIRSIVDDSLSYSAGKKPEDPQLRRRIATLLDQTEAHERAETDLIQDLLYSDLGEAG